MKILLFSFLCYFTAHEAHSCLQVVQNCVVLTVFLLILELRMVEVFLKRTTKA
jgi:hypothetical protein